MKRYLLITGVALAALSLAACNKPAETESAVIPAEEAATPAAATAPAAAPAAPATPDFVAKAAASDMFEVAAAEVAVKRATDPKVKAFAQMMVKDHTKSTADLKKAIAESNQPITPPATLPADMQAKLDDLNKAEAKDFDKAYMTGQVEAHQNALNLLQGYAQNGDVDRIKAFAAATAPVVQTHLGEATTLRDGLK